MISDIVKFWDQDHTGRSDKEESSYAREKEKFFPRNALVLDLGGGRGADSLYFSKSGHQVTLADISEVALNIAQEKAAAEGLNIATIFVNLGVDNLPFPDNTFDVIYSRLAIHYFDEITTESIFKEIYHKLKPEGKAYLTLKSPSDKEEMEFLHKNAQQIGSNVFKEGDIVKSRYTQEQLETMLRNVNIYNFTVKEIDENIISKLDNTKSGNKQLLLNEITITK